MVEPDVALALAALDAEIPSRHHLFAPALLRSQVPARLYVEAPRGKLGRKESRQMRW